MKAVTKTRHYDAIAREIQDLSGNKAKSSYKPSELAEGVRAVSGYQYEDGYSWGYTEGEEQGYNDGIDVGYNSGHKKGYNEGRESFPDADLISFPDASITEKAVTDTKYYDEIARALVGSGSALATLAPADMAYAVREVAETQYSDGKAQGRQEQNDELWVKLLNNGELTSYSHSFAGPRWDNNTFTPPKGLKMVASNMQRTFREAAKIEEIDFEIDITDIMASGLMGHTFFRCTKLRKIKQITVAETTPYESTTFESCTSLEELTIAGTIANNFDIHWSTKLSAASMLSILTACKKESAGVTITLPQKCIDGKTVTETYISNNTELNTALTNARLNGYTVSFD